jgi:hypothetical protein
MTNSWQEHRLASFRLQPIQLHQLEAAFLAAGIGPGMRVLDMDPALATSPSSRLIWLAARIGCGN